MASSASGKPSSNAAKRLLRSRRIFNTGTQVTANAASSAIHQTGETISTKAPAATPRARPSSMTR
ncbi:hypothetical protein D3C81_2282260 [compost metagenome]